MLRFGDDALFVCARDTGLFVSFFTLMLVLSLLRGRDRAGRPPLAVLALGAAGVLFLAWDGLTSYMGLRESTNVIRFLSGFAAGAGLAFPAAYAVNRFVFAGDRNRRVGSRPSDIAAAALAGGAAAALFLLRPSYLFRLGQVWLLLSMLGTFWILNLVLVYVVMGRGAGRLTAGRAVMAAALTVAELAGSYWLHRLLAGGGPEAMNALPGVEAGRGSIYPRRC